MAQRTRRGFTLIELLVVIAIIGLLSTLAVVAMSNARQKARDAKRVSDIKQIQSALDLYATDKNGYPADGADGAGGATLGSATAKCLNDTAGFGAAGCTGNVYMANVPSNPTPGGASYTYISRKADAADCNAADAPCVNYSITFTLESDTGELKATAPNKTPNCTATSGGITCT